MVPDSRDQGLSQKMRAVISRFPESGQNVPDFCKANQLSLSRYHYWRRKLGYYFRRTKASEGFVRLDVGEHHFTSRMSSSSFLGYELLLPGGLTLRFPLTFDPASLRQLLDILRG